jgi:hypothetical protein
VWNARRGNKKARREEPPGATEFAVSRLRFQPDERQRLVLESNSPRGILNCSRQWGKSTVAMVKAIHKAATQPGSLVLIATPSSRQSGELIHKAAKLMRRAQLPTRGDGYNEMSLQFANGSRIIGLPDVEETVRGFSEVALMVIDEASRVSESMYEALRPMLAVGGGHLWLMSTPWIKRGFFYETWEHGNSDWFKVKSPVTECARIKPEFLAEEQQELGEDKYRREYLCEFLDDTGAVFDRQLLENAIDKEVREMEF